MAGKGLKSGYFFPLAIGPEVEPEAATVVWIIKLLVFGYYVME